MRSQPYAAFCRRGNDLYRGGIHACTRLSRLRSSCRFRHRNGAVFGYPRSSRTFFQLLKKAGFQNRFEFLSFLFAVNYMPDAAAFKIKTRLVILQIKAVFKLFSGTVNTASYLDFLLILPSTLFDLRCRIFLRLFGLTSSCLSLG